MSHQSVIFFVKQKQGRPLRAAEPILRLRVVNLESGEIVLCSAQDGMSCWMVRGRMVVSQFENYSFLPVMGSEARTIPKWERKGESNHPENVSLTRQGILPR